MSFNDEVTDTSKRLQSTNVQPQHASSQASDTPKAAEPRVRQKLQSLHDEENVPEEVLKNSSIGAACGSSSNSGSAIGKNVANDFSGSSKASGCTTSSKDSVLDLSQTSQAPSCSSSLKKTRRSGSIRRCQQCRKRLGLVMEFTCRCGALLCAEHRYAESHECQFDYLEQGRRELTRNNPRIHAEKVQRL